MNTNNDKILLTFSDWESSIIRTVMIAVLVGVTFYFAAILGRTLSTPPDYIATFWLPNAIILAALLLSDRRRWWIFILAMIPAFILAVLQTGRPVQIATIYFTADCTEIFVAAFVLTFIFGNRLKFDRLHEMVMFLLWAVLIAPVVSAFVASTTTLVEPEVDYWLTWRIWFLGDAIGHLALTPVIILWVTSGLGWVKGVSFARLCEALGLVLSILAVGYFLLGTEIRASGNLPALLYTPLPVLLWAAIRFGPRGICSAIFVITLLAIWNATNGRGPFTANTPADNVLSLQLFLFAISIPLMLLGSLLSERKQAKKAIEESETKFRNLVEGSLQGIFVHRDFKLLFANQKCADIFGYSNPEEILKLDGGWEAFLAPEEQERIRDYGTSRMKGDEVPTIYECQGRRKDGSLFWLVNFVTTIDWQGEKAIQGAVIDITERKQAEEALYESENKYRTLFEKSADAILIIEGTKFVDCNQATLKMLGYKNKKDLIGTHPAEISPEIQPDGSNSFEKQNQILSTVYDHSSIRFEWDHTRQNGEVFPVEVLLTPVPLGERKFIHCVWRDITERKQTEELLKKSEEKLSKAFRATPDAVGISRLSDGIFIYANPGMAKLVNFPVEKLIGRTSLDVNLWANPDDRAKVVKILKDEGEVSNFETNFRTRDGKILPMSTAASLIELEGEKYIVSFTRDITEQKHAEKLLEDRLCQQIKIVDLGQRALSGEPLFDLMNKLVKDVAEVLDIEYCNVLELTPERDGLLLCSGVGWQEGLVGQAIVDPDSNSQAGYTLLSHEPVVVEDLRTEKRFSGPSLLIDHGVISGMSVIIGKPDQPYGLLGVHSTEKRLFTESDINFLQAVAHVLSSAIESKHANDQILQSREQLRNLTSELQVAREEERTRISREIHDELGQNLTGLRIDLKWMLDQLPKKNKDLADRAQMALLLADKTLDSVQKLSQELRPSVLDDLGLEPAIKWQINEFIRHTTCHCNLEMNIKDLDTNDKRDINVFRVLQEALTNIMRHAEASQVNVSMQTTNGRMLLEISDNGRGITTDKLDSSNSIGLIGMRERAIELGGHIEIQCQQSGGTLVQLDIPLQRN